MFEDANSNGMWDASELLLNQHAPLNERVWAQGNATVNRYISFGASGRSLALNGAFQAGTLSFCELQNREAQGWLLVINAVGRPRLEKSQVSACP
jgi:Tfp pilus assembly protein FimT